MHPTLKPHLTLIGAIVFAVVGVVALAITRPVPLVPAFVGVLLGVATGLLQKRGIEAAPDALQRAETAMEVRRALTSTSPGKWAVAAQWVGAFLVLGAAFWTGNLIGGATSGFALLMSVRDFLTWRAVGPLAS